MRRPLGAALAALLLLTFAAPELLVLWESAAPHAHDHGAAHVAGEWVQRTADHAPHDASQLEDAEPVRHGDCVVCAGRLRTFASVLGGAEPLGRRDARTAVSLAASHPPASRMSTPSRPRGPPTV